MSHTTKLMTLERAKDICLQWIAATASNGSMCAMAESRIKEVFADLAKQREAVPVAWMDKKGSFILNVIKKRYKDRSNVDDYSTPLYDRSHCCRVLDVRIESDDAEEIAQCLHAAGHHKAARTIRTQLDVRNELIRNLQQRNAVEVTDWEVETVSQVLRDFGWASGGDYEEDFKPDVRAALSAVASRDNAITEDLVRKAWIAFDGQWYSDRDSPESMQRMRRVIEVIDDVASRDREDAERYRWLRDKSRPELCAFYLSVYLLGLENILFEPKTIDEAIDAARRENKP